MKIVINNNGKRIPATLEVVDGVMIVSPKEKKVDITQFKDGDIITCGWNNEFNSCSWVSVLNGIIEEYKDNYFLDEYCGTYLVGCESKEQIWINSYSDSATWVRHATEEEKQKLFDALAKEGKVWDSEKKAVVDLKWEPKVGDTYFRPNFNRCMFMCYEGKYRFDTISYIKDCVEKGWCFKTEKECQEFCNRLNDAINSVKL